MQRLFLSLNIMISHQFPEEALLNQGTSTCMAEQCCSSGSLHGQCAVFMVHIGCSSHSPISYIKQCGFSQQEALLYPRSAVQLPLPQLSSQPQQCLRKCNTLNRMAVCASTQTDCIHKLPLLWACTRTGMAPKMEQKATEAFMLPNTLAVTWILGNALHRTMHDLGTETHLHDLSLLYSWRALSLWLFLTFILFLITVIYDWVLINFSCLDLTYIFNWALQSRPHTGGSCTWKYPCSH